MPEDEGSGTVNSGKGNYGACSMVEDEIGPKPPLPQDNLDGCEDKDRDKKRRKVLEFEKDFLKDLPSSGRYEKSFMHRDVLSHVVVSKGGFVITASCDGHVKFWKKDNEGFEFVKHFRAHLGNIEDIAVDFTGRLLITISNDNHGKVFDVQNFDMINILKFGNRSPTCCVWCHRSDDVISAVAIGFRKENSIYIYDGKGDGTNPIKLLDKYHFNPVVTMAYNALFDVVISADVGGMLEYWHGPQGSFSTPEGGIRGVMFDSKLDTDLFEFAKNKTYPISLAFAPNGKLFAAFGNDRKIRVFRFLTGKLYCVLDETLEQYMTLQSEKKIFSSMDFNRKISNEKDMEKSVDGKKSPFSHSNVVFDKTGNFILYPTLNGVKVVNIFNNRSCGVIGKGENLRFLNVALSQGSDELTDASFGGAGSVPASIEEHVAENPSTKKVKAEPILFSTAYKKNRFYLFTRTEPRDSDGGSDRDVFNEKPSQEERFAVTEEPRSVKVFESATIHTSMGDVFLKLFARECPKTVENFCALAKNNYYNGCIFHRVIKQFMLQTGDPTGIGTGGESHFGHEFEDELHPKLRHDRPYTLSMANAGPNTNGSQFFITVAPTPWLDNKHTVFGRVVRGMDVALSISNVKTHPKTDKPYDDVTVLSVSLKEPFEP